MTTEKEDGRGSFITRQEASDIALAAAKEGARQSINDVFALLGVNLANFESVQTFRDDLEWARRTRKTSELTGKRVWTSIVGVASAGVAVAVWSWLTSMFPHHLP